jgi:2-hydroxy-6-oxonona-2,4-dienedioate hydrolase
MRSMWFEVGKRRMHVRVCGVDDGPVVVLVHGFVVSSRYMMPLARALESTHKIYSVDLPGSGRSRSGDVLDTRELGHVLAQWLAVADLNDVTIAANSYGCQVAAEAAAVEPDRVSQLVLIGPTVDPTAARPLLQMGRFARQFWREPWWFWLVATRDLFTFGFNRAWITIRNLARHDMLQAMRSVRSPVLVIRGEHDAVCPQSWADLLAEAAGSGDVLVVPGVAHTTHTRRPAEIAAGIVAATTSASEQGGVHP